MTNLNRIAACAIAASLLSSPALSLGQQYPFLHAAVREDAMLQVTEAEHERAKQQQTEEDHRKHTGAKVVGGTAAGGAVVGALAGGGKGALIGGAAGAGAGAVANKVRKDKAVKKRERRESPQ